MDDYIVITSFDLSILLRDVNKKISIEGYKLLGGVQVLPFDQEIRKFGIQQEDRIYTTKVGFYQTLYRDNNENY